MLKNQKIHIFTGHYGSGKTEVALNFAIQAANKGEKVTIIDLDTVNPYFRTNDVKTLLQNHGISVIASEFASTNIDMPTVPATVLGVFETDGTIIFDVGGDDDGAYALGQYLRFFEDTDYQMHLVINSRRPLTATSKEMVDMAVIDAKEDEEEVGDAPVIVAEMQTELPICTVSGAVMRMDLAGLPALMFKNSAHGGLNMVYRRTDGNIGWIDPKNKIAAVFMKNSLFDGGAGNESARNFEKAVNNSFHLD
jgi:hypothetical protein